MFWGVSFFSLPADGICLEKKYLESKFEKNIFSLIFSWLVVGPTHLKNIGQIGPLPQIGMNMKHISNHDPGSLMLLYTHATSLDIQNPPVIPGEDLCLEPKQDLLRRCLGVQNGFHTPIFTR